MNGWIKLHRKIRENIELQNDPTARLLFMDLLLMANPQGKVSVTMRDLCKSYGVEASTILRATKRLEKWGMAQHTTQHKKSVILICNWSKYQSSTQQQTQHRRNTDATHTSVSKNRE
jgi:DNA-binding MurR/RpiR family transcriptional regulator